MATILNDGRYCAIHLMAYIEHEFVQVQILLSSVNENLSSNMVFKN